MKSLGLNLKDAKKVAGDKHSSTFQLGTGHKIQIVHAPLSHMHRKQIESMPIQKMADGDSDVQVATDPSAVSIPDSAINPNAGQASADNAVTPISEQQNLIDNPPAGLTSEDVAAVLNPTPQAAPIQNAPVTDQRAPASNNSRAMPGGAASDAFEQQKAAQMESARAQQAQGTAESAALQDVQDKTAELPTYQQNVDKWQQSNDALLDQYRKQKLDPNQYWQNHSKVAAGIGMLLGGLGAHATGGQNMAVQQFNRGMDQEIDRQKNEQGKSLNLLQMNQQALGNHNAAVLATQNQLATGLKYKLEQAAANAKGPLAIAAAHNAIAQINQEQALRNMKLGFYENSSDDISPEAKLGQGMRLGIISPEAGQKIAEEIKNRRDIVALKPQVDQAFDQAAQETRPLSGGLNTSGTAFVPGMDSPSQKKYLGLTGTTVKETEGTARAQAFKLIHDTQVPQFGDNDASIETKRSTKDAYMASHAAAPLAKSYGIDLDRYPVTRLGQSAVVPSVAQPSVSKSGKPIVWRGGKAYYK
jgi:hypothetical protein